MISKAAKSLCIWLHAVYAYRSATIRTHSAPPPTRSNAHALTASGGAPLQAVREDLEVVEQAADADLRRSLNRHDLVELRSLKKPPAGVDSVTAATLLLLGHEGTPTWAAAQQLLSSPSAFVERLRCFDASSAESRVRIERARPLLKGSHMATEAVRKKSNAAAGLVAWAHAVVSGEAALSGNAVPATAHDGATAVAAVPTIGAAPTAWRMSEVRAASDANEKSELLDGHLKAAAQAGSEAVRSRLAKLRSSAASSAEEAEAVEALARVHDLEASRWHAARHHERVPVRRVQRGARARFLEALSAVSPVF